MSTILDKPLLRNRTRRKRLDLHRVRHKIATILTSDQKLVDVLRRRNRKILTKDRKKVQLPPKKDIVQRLRVIRSLLREGTRLVLKEIRVEAERNHQNDRGRDHTLDREDLDRLRIRDRKRLALEIDLEDQGVLLEVGIPDDPHPVRDRIEGGGEDQGQKVAAGVRDLTDIDQLVDFKRYFIRSEQSFFGDIYKSTLYSKFVNY